MVRNNQSMWQTEKLWKKLGMPMDLLYAEQNKRKEELKMNEEKTKLVDPDDKSIIRNVRVFLSQCLEHLKTGKIQQAKSIMTGLVHDYPFENVIKHSLMSSADGKQYGLKQFATTISDIDKSVKRAIESNNIEDPLSKDALEEGRMLLNKSAKELYNLGATPEEIQSLNTTSTNLEDVNSKLELAYDTIVNYRQESLQIDKISGGGFNENKISDSADGTSNSARDVALKNISSWEERAMKIANKTTTSSVAGENIKATTASMRKAVNDFYKEFSSASKMVNFPEWTGDRNIFNLQKMGIIETLPTNYLKFKSDRLAKIKSDLGLKEPAPIKQKLSKTETTISNVTNNKTKMRGGLQ